VPSAPAQRSPWLTARAWFSSQGGLAGLVEVLLPPRPGRDEMDEAYELLAYWEGRARRLPRWAVRRRREAREMAGRWRARVRAAEQARYGRGVLGAATQMAVERRMPATLAHRGRQAVRVGAYTAAVAAISVLVVLVAAAAMVAEALFSLL
jgi:hypothetical protein